MIFSPIRNIRHVDGKLLADVADGQTAFPRPCDAASVCGPVDFVFNGAPGDLDEGARAAAGLAAAAPVIIPLRGEWGDFIVFMAIDGQSFSIAALSRGKTTLTVRVEDAWEKLPPAERKYSYLCETLCETIAEGAEGKFQVAPDARIFVDLEENGGFVIKFTPEEETR